MAWENKHVDYVEIPLGSLLKATLVEIETNSVPYTDKKTGEHKSFDKLNWKFTLDEPQYNGAVVRGETSAEMSDHPNNTFRMWVEGLLGRDIPVGAVVSEADLIGLSALITIKEVADRRDASKKWRRVDDVIPLDNGDPPF